MKISEISFKNINSYCNKLQTIKFNDKPELILLRGDNGAGKTTIANVISYSLYNSVHGRKLSRLPNRYNKGLETSIKFTNTKNDVVELKRGLSPRFFDLSVNGKPKNTSVKDINEYVENELIGIPYDVFANSILLSLDDFESFVKMKVEKKRKIIDKIFDSSIINLMFNNLKIKYKSINEELNSLIEQRDEINKQLDIKYAVINNLDLNEDEYAQKESELNQLQTEKDTKINEFTEKIDDINKQIESLNKEKDDINNQINLLNSKLNVFTNDLNNNYRDVIAKEKSEFAANIAKSYETTKTEISTQLNNISSELQNVLDEINKQKQNAQNEFTSSYDNAIDHKVKELIDVNNAKINESNVLINEFENNLKLNAEETHKLDDEINKIVKDIIIVESSSKQYKEKYDLFLKGVCPVCGSDLTKNHTHTVDDYNQMYLEENQKLKSLNEKKTVILNKIHELQVKYNEQKTLLDNEKNKMVSLLEYNQNIKNVLLSNNREYYNKEIEKINDTFAKKINDANNKFSKMRDELYAKNKHIDDLIKDEIEKKNVDIDLYYKNIIDDEYKKYMDIHNKDLTELNTKISKLNSDITKKINERDSLTKEKDVFILDYTEKIKPYSSYIDNYNRNKNILDETNKDILKYEKELKEAEDVIYKLNEQIDVYKVAYELLDENGIKRKIIDTNLPAFNESINNFISYLDFPYDFQFDNKFDVSIYKYNFDVDPSELSKGETRLMDLIIVLSVFDLIIKKIPDLNVIFLDEIFTNLSISNIEKVVKLLKKYTSTYDINIFVVSHTPVPLEYFDKIYQAENVDECSNLIEIKK